MKHFSLPKDGGLISAGLPDEILHSYEKIPVKVFETAEDACSRVADLIIGCIKAHGPGFRLGVSTGSTMFGLFKELAERYRAGEISFKDVVVYSIDEYAGPDYDASRAQNSNYQSRNYRLHEDFIDQVDFRSENVHIPDGNMTGAAATAYCEEYDRQISNLDLIAVGVGKEGQIGFNSAGTSTKSRTRHVLLSYGSRKSQARNFNGDFSITPKAAITAGIGTVLSAKKIVLLAWGEDKARVVYDTVEADASENCPSSLLQAHDKVTLFADENSAELLTRNVAPWLIGPCDWTPKFIRKAVVWLCEKVGKPVLKLTEKDYLENSLGELLEQKGSFDSINIKVFNDLQHTITGWPGGKPNADDATRPVPSAPFPKKVVIFSPHPDDDVISMGGTFIRLVEQGHDVHVAYETSGNVAVHDDVVLQHMDAAHELGFADKFDEVKKIVDGKKPGEPEPRALLDLKAAIRRSEARGAVRSFGLNDNTNAHFLNLPFYETGGIKKGQRTQKDIDIIKDLLQKVQPDQIYMAGDLADPHGTHRVCTEAVLEALKQLEDEPWMNDCHAWLYRGAWMEWEIGKVDMAVPLSPGEVIKKRHAIYRHLSQKDIVPFPGDDSREFWQRAEDRTQNTARLYNAIGMAEYQAMEVFVKLF